jgi:nitroreductase
MEFRKVVGSRRSTRYYKPYQPVEKSKIQAILEAARLQSNHGNASDIRKAVVITKGETPDPIRNALIEALYNQPQAAQAPVMIVWCCDMSGWQMIKPRLMELIKVGALNSSYGWSEEFIDNVVMKTPDFNVCSYLLEEKATGTGVSPDEVFAKWLSSFECGLAVGSALLAAVDEGLGTQLLTGNRDKIRETLGMPADVTPTQIQILGYPAESADCGGQRPRPAYESLYYNGKWGEALKRDAKVTAELEATGLFQTPAPTPWRAQEVRALAAMFELPE